MLLLTDLQRIEEWISILLHMNFLIFLRERHTSKIYQSNLTAKYYQTNHCNVKGQLYLISNLYLHLIRPSSNPQRINLGKQNEMLLQRQSVNMSTNINRLLSLPLAMHISINHTNFIRKKRITMCKTQNRYNAQQMKRNT